MILELVSIEIFGSTYEQLFMKNTDDFTEGGTLLMYLVSTGRKKRRFCV